MSNRHPEFMTTKKERLSSWTYFIGQNIYYNITAAFLSAYLAMQGINRVFSGGVSCAAFCFYGNRTRRSQFFYEKFISRQKCVLLDTMYGILHLAAGFPWFFVVLLHRNTFVTGLYLDKPKALWQYIVEVDAF